jgi:hypothetical protein
MLLLVSDENVHGDIIRGPRTRIIGSSGDGQSLFCHLSGSAKGKKRFFQSLINAAFRLGEH